MRGSAEHTNHNSVTSSYGLTALPDFFNISFVQSISLKVWRELMKLYTLIEGDEMKCRVQES